MPRLVAALLAALACLGITPGQAGQAAATATDSATHAFSESAVAGVETGKVQTPQVAARVDWSAVRVGDRVPTSAFPAPATRPRASVRVQEGTLARKGNRNRLVIPSMRAVAPLTTSAIHDGHVPVPKGGRVGWLSTTSRPGSKRGVIVVAGHRDVRKGAKAGPLYGAERLKPGAQIKVVWRGHVYRYAVTRVTKHERHALPARLFDPNGAGRLAVITCTGPYRLGKGGHYWLSRNAIIWAEKIR